MKVPFLDLRAAYHELKVEIDEAVLRVLDSGWYILGDEVEAFEREFADFVEAGHCVGVGNGLDALTLSLKALEIGPGDEVIVPSHTFIATWLAVSEVGATPVPVDPDEKTYTIDPARIEAVITDKTRAIIPVHLYGHPADLDPILAVASRHNLRVVEDAAQAHGARYKGRRVGAHGNMVTWSFYPGKNLGAMGDGGAITTDDANLAEQIRLLRNYGSREKYRHEIQGTNSRLDPIQAAVLRVKLGYLDEWNQRRSNCAKQYINVLRSTSLSLPGVAQWADPVWHLFVIQSDDRERLQKSLDKAGVDSMVHYPHLPHEQPAYSSLSRAVKWSSPALAARVLSLPIGPHQSKMQIEKVIQAILDA